MRRIFIPLYLFALMVYIAAGVPLTPFHGDEATLIYGTNDYFDQFVERDMERVMNLRDDDPLDSDLRLLDGRIQTYLGGFAYHLIGGTKAGLNKPWMWGGVSSAENINNGHVPTHDLLMAQRYAMALLTALSIPVAYGIGAHVGGPIGGLLMATLIAVSPNLILNGRRAMMEAPLLLFSLLAVLSALEIAARLRRNAPRVGLFIILLGVSTGMAVAAKHNAVLSVLPLFAALALWFGLRRRWRYFAALVAAGLLSVAIYFILSPAWWSSPMGALREMLDLRENLLTHQRASFGGYENFSDQLKGIVKYGILERPQYAEVDYWEEVAPFIADYEASPFILPPALNLLRAGITVLLALVGVYVLARRRDLVTWVAGLWIGFTLVTIFVLTPLPWARYYLPALPAIYMLAAAGIGWLWAARHRIKTE